jgi:oligosaccharyl transferase (archaeosortase A-associated)
MKNQGLLTRLAVIALVTACVGLALYYRVVLPYDKIFTADWIKFSGTDSYLFMRMADNIIHNYPQVINFDPYSLYPGGFPILTPPFFPFLVATSVLIGSLGNPSQAMIDTIGVFVPAVLGALTVIPAFFIAKYLFNRWAGVIAAALVAILPGEFLGRSILGFTDQHVAETFFSTLAVLFFILALRVANGQPDIMAGWRENRKAVYRLLTFSILSGVFLGTYLVTWFGALLFVLIFFIYLVIQQIINHYSRTSMGSLTAIAFIVFLVALVIFIFTSRALLTVLPLLIGVIIPVVLYFFSQALRKYQLNNWIFPLTIIGAGILLVICFRLINPAYFDLIYANFSDVFLWPRNSTILEKQPLFFPSNQFSFAAVWGNFTSGFFLSLAGLGLLICYAFKQRKNDIVFLLVWCVLVMAATLSQRRFAYYCVVNVAILSGFVCWTVFENTLFGKKRAVPVMLGAGFTFFIAVFGLSSGWLAWFPDVVICLIIAIIIGLGVYLFSRASSDQPMKEALKNSRQSRKVQSREGATKLASRVNPILAIAAVFCICLSALAPNRVIAQGTASGVSFAPSNAWCESLTWLNTNTPEPFNNKDYYYEYYREPSPGQAFQYPSTAYSIASWWDYGYWITRIGHRIPVSNPGTNHYGEANYFMAKNEKTANEMMNKWNSRYVIINNDMVMPLNKLYALATLSGGDIYDYIEVLYSEKNGQIQPQILYRPAYFQTMVVRLYNFGGKSFIPKEAVVITYQQKKTSDGQPFKAITSSKVFNTYEAAQAYVAGLKTSDLAGIFSPSAFSSPIPLEELKGYKLVHDSADKTNPEPGITWPEIKIFEYNR